MPACESKQRRRKKKTKKQDQGKVKDKCSLKTKPPSAKCKIHTRRQIIANKRNEEKTKPCSPATASREKGTGPSSQPNGSNGSHVVRYGALFLCLQPRRSKESPQPTAALSETDLKAKTAAGPCSEWTPPY